MLAEDAVQTGVGMDTVTGSFVHELEHADSVRWMRHRCQGFFVSLGRRRQGYN